MNVNVIVGLTELFAYWALLYALGTARVMSLIFWLASLYDGRG